MMNTSLESLKNSVNAIRTLNDEEWNAFAAIWKPFSAKRKETITIAGEKEKYLYFVLEGIQHMYYFDEQGREASVLFTYAPSFGGVLDSLMLQKPSKFYYETLTPSSFVKTTYKELETLTKSYPNIEFIVRQGITQAMSGVLERLVELQCFSSEEKFRALLKRSPHILQLIPHKYLANYLGIDATNFSKLMNRVKI